MLKYRGDISSGSDLGKIGKGRENLGTDNRLVSWMDSQKIGCPSKDG